MQLTKNARSSVCLELWNVRRCHEQSEKRRLDRVYSCNTVCIDANHSGLRDRIGSTFGSAGKAGVRGLFCGCAVWRAIDCARRARAVMKSRRMTGRESIWRPSAASVERLFQLPVTRRARRRVVRLSTLFQLLIACSNTCSAVHRHAYRQSTAQTNSKRK